jgi:DNA-binding CsgD family transcriptional regulator
VERAMQLSGDVSLSVALFISPKTVDVNLYRVYRKLDIQSRSQLARRLIHRTEP